MSQVATPEAGYNHLRINTELRKQADCRSRASTPALYLSLRCPFNYVLCGDHVTQTHKQSNSHYSSCLRRTGWRPAVVKRRAEDRKEWKKASSWPKRRLKGHWDESHSLFSWETKTAELGWEESRKGIKSLSTGLCNRILHYMKLCLIQFYAVERERWDSARGSEEEEEERGGNRRPK